MLYALAEAMGTKGYVGTSVADVIRGAGVSRETFYQQFSSKQDCFIEAFDTAAEVLLPTLRQAGQTGGSAPDRLERLLAAYLDAMAGEPALARVFLIEVYAAGPEALMRRADVQQRFVDIVAAALDARSSRTVFACEAFVAAVSSMVTARLAAGDLAGLQSLQAPFAELARRAIEVGDGGGAAGAG